MTALATSDVTVTIEDRQIQGKQRLNRLKLVFGDGALTYPSGGVPVPAYGTLGMKARLDYLNVTDPDDATGYVWKYDQANNKLRAYQSPSLATGSVGALSELATSAALATSQTLFAEARGW